MVHRVTGRPEADFLCDVRTHENAASPDSRLQIGPNALVIAAGRGYADVVQMLLDKGVDVNARLFGGTTPILIAAANANTDIVKLLMKAHADVNLADQHGDTALMAAVRAGSLAIVHPLLSGGANVNAADNGGRTAAWWVSRTDRIDILKELANRGADVRLADQRGGTPFMQATKMGRNGMAHELRTRDAAGIAPRHTPRPLLAAIDAGVTLIQSRAELWEERLKCASCHHTFTGGQATLLAKQYGVKINEGLAGKLLARLREQINGWERGSAKAITSREASAGPSVPLFRGDRAYALAARLGSSPGLDQPPDQRFGNLAMVLANLQFEDGRWTHGPPRFPIESSDALTTAYAIRGLQRHAPADARQRIDKQIHRATDWLQHTTATTTDDLVGQLYGLYWSNTGAAHVGKASGELLRQQRPDGSWAQKRGMNGDAYATGLALVALHDTRQLAIRARAYQLGVEFLLSSQEDDGSWLVPTRAVPINGYVESGSPHEKHQFVSFGGTCWATMALTIASREIPR